MLVQIDEVNRAIRSLPFVTKLSPVRAHIGHGDGWGNDGPETERKETSLMTENTRSASNAGTTTSRASMQGQAAAAVVTVLSDTRAPTDQ